MTQDQLDKLRRANARRVAMGQPVYVIAWADPHSQDFLRIRCPRCHVIHMHDARKRQRAIRVPCGQGSALSYIPTTETWLEENGVI